MPQKTSSRTASARTPLPVEVPLIDRIPPLIESEPRDQRCGNATEADIALNANDVAHQSSNLLNAALRRLEHVREHKGQLAAAYDAATDEERLLERQILGLRETCGLLEKGDGTKY